MKEETETTIRSAADWAEQIECGLPDYVARKHKYTEIIACVQAEADAVGYIRGYQRGLQDARDN